MKRTYFIGSFVALIAMAFISSCGGGPVGGFEVSVYVNDTLQEFEEARIYVDKINLFLREDGTIGYELLPPVVSEYSHLLFTLVGGEKGSDPVFSVNWVAQADSVPEIAGRNFAVYSIKMFPDIQNLKGTAKTTDYIASYNEETCYILLTITRVDPANGWINGIFNGVYVEKVGGAWRRIEVHEGRFGGRYSLAKAHKPEKQE